MIALRPAEAQTICPKDGALLWEDSDFARNARAEGVEVHRLVCVGGHSYYYPPVEARGWTPRSVGERRCDRCGTTIPGVRRLAHGVGPRRCATCAKKTGPCIVCGGPTTGNRKTCSDACLHRCASETGRRALAALQAERAG